MKKLFSLFVVLSVALVSMASGHAPKGAQIARKADVRMAQHLNLPAVNAAAPMKAPARVAEDMVLTCDSVDVTFYSSSYYSKPGAYDYYIVFHNIAEVLPIVYIDLYLPTDTGLVAGYYTSEDGNVDLSTLTMYLDEWDYELGYYYGYPPYTFVDAIVQVDDNGDGTWTITAILTDDEGNTYEASVTQAIAVDEDTYDGGNTGGTTTDDNDYYLEPTTPSTVSQTMTDIEFDTDYFSQYGDVDVYLYRIVGGDTVESAPLYFYVNAIDPDIFVPAGTYTINGTNNVGTVEASEGLLDYSAYGYGYVPSAAYYALIGSDGYITSLYYLVSGTVTVTKVGTNGINIVVNAKSGNGSTVNLTYSSAQVALEDVEGAAEFQKVIENGQLLIIKNGVRYNALGAVVE